MKQKFVTAVFIILNMLASDLHAQENYDITFDDASFKLGLQLSPNGYGVFYRNAVPFKHQTFRLFDISISSVKNMREKQVLNQRMVNTSPYIYGKVNRLYAIRPLFGLQKTLAEKHNKNSVGVNLFALTGPLAGVLKPVFVDVESFDPTFPGIIISSSVRYNPELQNHASITGYSSFGKGISDSRIVAGWSFKSGVEFNWGYYSSEYKSLEVGVLIDCFPGRPELMHFVKNKIVYSSFYLSFAFGKNY